MPKFKVCVTKFTEHFEIVEVEAETDLEARRNAIMLLKDEESEFRWNEGEKPRFRAEVVNE